MRFNYLKSSFVILTAMLAFMSSCSSKPSNVIKIGVLQGPTYVSFLHLMNNPPVIDGKEIEFVLKDDPQQIQALMLKDELDFAVLPTVMAANLYNKGMEYSMVACPVWGTLYIVTTDKQLSSLHDLSGRTVSVFGQGATPDVLLQRFVRRNRLENINIDYTFTNNNDLSMALLNKRVNLAVVSEPMVSMLMYKDKSVRIIAKLDCEAYLNYSDKDIFVQTAFMVRNKFAVEYPTTMKLICDSYLASCNSVNTDPEKTADLMLEKQIVPDKTTALASLPLCNIQYVAAFSISQEVHKYLQIFQQTKPEAIGGQIPDRNFIYQPQ